MPKPAGYSWPNGLRGSIKNRIFGARGVWGFHINRTQNFKIFRRNLNIKQREVTFLRTIGPKGIQKCEVARENRA